VPAGKVTPKPRALAKSVVQRLIKASSDLLPIFKAVLSPPLLPAESGGCG
jgi:hypothetical protein